MIARMLLPLLPALLLLITGMIMHAPTLVKAGIWAAAIISASTLLTTAALRSHSSFRTAIGVSAAALGVRLGGLILVCLVCNGRPGAMTIQLAVAGCLFVNVIIEGILSARASERSAHAR